MSLIADLVRRTAEQLRSERGIDVGLDKVAQDVEVATDLGAGATSVRRALKKRARALDEAQAELLSLIKKVEHLKAILPFKEEGWPSQHARLQRLTVSDPAGAVRAWLQYWFEAVGSCRLDAAGRLVREVPLPAGAGLIAERATVAATGVERRDWDLAAPTLLAGADGLRVGADVVPTPEVRASLQRLLARLALVAGRLDEADSLVRKDLEWAHNAASLALQARRCNLAGDEDQARSLLLQAQSANPGDLDVVTELVRQGRKTLETEAVLEAAQIGIDALPSLLDIDSDLGRLLEPPAELWIALSDRARREAMPDLGRRALDEAERLIGPDEHELWASIGERRATTATSATERVRALRDAGDRRLAADDLKRARLNFIEAVDEPGDADPQERASAALRYADTVAALDASQPLRLVRDEVADALRRLLEAQAIEGMAAAESWSYLTQAYLRLNLARGADPARADQAWRAFLAASRAVALSPNEAHRWSILADVAPWLTCYRTAEAAARHALEKGGPAQAPPYIQALTNLGWIDQAIGLINATDPWSECVRAYLFLRQGKPEEVVRLLRAVTIDPSWAWAQETLVSALLLTGQFEEAQAEAAKFARIASERVDEADFLFSMAFYEQVCGRSDRAAELAERRLEVDQGFGENDATALLGEVLLLRGDRDAGIRLLQRAASSFRDRRIDDWSRIERPMIAALARWRGVDLGDPSALDAIVEQRREEIAAISDPPAELAQAPAGGADPEVVRSARALGTALLHVAGGNEARAGEALAEIGTDLEDEARSLRAYLRSLANERRHAELAAQVVELSSTGDRTAASGVLAQLLDEVPHETDNLLRQQGTDEELRPVADVLTELAARPQYEESAANVQRWLGLAEPEPEISSGAGLRLYLPGSWFADYADPLHEHPLFLRYLPELRARADWEVPGVNVMVEDSLEPDGYRIWAHGELLDQGRVQPDARYCSEGALEFLPAELRSAAISDQDLALRRIPESAVKGQGGIADLLTMPPIEVVARSVGAASKDLAERRTLAT